MKTLLAQYWVARMGQPTLFFSADTDAATITKRAGAMVTGDTQDEVGRGLRGDKAADYAEALARLNHIRWVFESDPTYADLELETAAFAEAHGQFPAVIVIDNLMNVVGENEDEWGSMRDTTRALHRLVRVTDAAVFVLHHMSERKADNTQPAPRSDLQGKVSQLPELILSLAFDPELGVLNVGAVKNRFGPADASGRTFTSLLVDPARVQVYVSAQARMAGYAA